MSVYSNWKYFFDSFWKFVFRNGYPIVLVLFFYMDMYRLVSRGWKIYIK